MTVLLKLIYAAAVAALFVLFVAFGIRAVYAPPEAPEYPIFPRSIVPVAPGEPLTEEQKQFEEEQRRYQEEYREYEQDLERYHSVVLALTALFGVGAVAGGVLLKPHLDALRLGLVGGGLLTLIYGVIQAEGDLDDLGAVAGFIIAGVGLVLVLVAGYRWLERRET